MTALTWAARAGRLGARRTPPEVQPVPLLALLALVPLFDSGQYFMHLMTTSLIFGVLAMGLQFVTGIAGQFSVGHVAFYGLGAYGSAVLTTRYSIPVPLGALAGTAIAAGAGAAMAPITRLRGNYMAMATLAFLLVANIFFVNLTGITGGVGGLAAVPAPSFFGTVITDGTPYFYLSLVLLVFFYVLLARLSGDSRFGRALAMIRQNETAASSIGVNPTAYKVKAFVISAAVAGFAGAMFAHQVRYVHPNDFTLTVAIDVLMMIVVGGLGSLVGAIIGGFVFALTPEYLRFLQDYRLLVYGVIIIVIMIFLPRGIAGAGKDLFRVSWSWLERQLALDGAPTATARVPEPASGD